MAEVEITQQSGDDSAAESISLPSDTPSKSRHDNNLQTHEEIFDQHDFQIQQIFDNKHHDINFDDDDGTAASWGEESFGNSTIASYESLGNASLTELRSALIARRRRLLDEGSITRGHRRGTSLDGSLGSLSFASLTESLTSLTRRKKKKKKDKSKKDKKDKKKKKKGNKSKDKDKKASKKKSKNSESRKSKEKHPKGADDGSLKRPAKDADDDSLKKRVKDADDGSLKDKKKRTNSECGTLDKSERSREANISIKKLNKSLFNFSSKSPLGTSSERDFSRTLSGNDAMAFVFYACDENTGCCAFHPEVQLRRKARLGGWVDVLKQCPKCNDPNEGGPLSRGGDNSSLLRGESNNSQSLRDDHEQTSKPRDSSELDEKRTRERERRQALERERRQNLRNQALDGSRGGNQPSSSAHKRGTRQGSNRDRTASDRREPRSNRSKETHQMSYRGSSRQDMRHSSRSDKRATNRILDNDRKSKTETRSGRLSHGVGGSNQHSQREHREHTKGTGRGISRRANQSSTKPRPHRLPESSSSSSSDSSSSSSTSSDLDLLQKSKISTSRNKTPAPKSQKAPNRKIIKSNVPPDLSKPINRSIRKLDRGDKRLERQESGLSKSKGAEGLFVDPAYKDAKDLSRSVRSRASSKGEARKPQSSKDNRHTLNRQSTGSSGKSKPPMMFKTVDFNPPRAPRSDTGSDHSLIESVEAAHYRHRSKESLDELVFDKVYSTEHGMLESKSLAGSNFNNTLDGDASEEGARKERDHHGTRRGDRDRVSKSLRHTDESSHLADRKYSKSAHFEFDHNNSLTSLNRSEPSLMETSADISPNIVLDTKAKFDEHRKAKWLKADSAPKGKHTPFYEHGQTKLAHQTKLESKAAPKGKSGSFSKSAMETTRTRLDLSERSNFSDEESITDIMKGGDGIKKMSRQEMAAFVALESMARQKSRNKSMDQKSSHTTASASGTTDDPHNSAEISSSLLKQVGTRLISNSAEGNDDVSKDMDIKDLMKYYADNDDNSASHGSATIVTNLQWQDIGMYTGQVNENIEPHGQGKLVMRNGATLYGQWANGKPLANSSPNSTDPKKSRNSYNERESDDEVPAYKLGDEGRRRDMVKEKDKQAANARISKLTPGAAGFIRRTDGAWTFARLKKITHDTAYFIVNSAGSTKSYKVKYWYSHIRTCNIPNERLPSYESPLRRSSNDSVMSGTSEYTDVSQLASMLKQPNQEESSPKESPPKTFEINEVRTYDPSKNRFSIKELLLLKEAKAKEASTEPTVDLIEESSSDDYGESSSSCASHDDNIGNRRHSTVDGDEDSRDTTQTETTNKSLLRKGRFSFNDDGPPVNPMARNVSFSDDISNKTEDSHAKDAPDDISTKTEDEDNFILGTSQTGQYSLRGLEP